MNLWPIKKKSRNSEYFEGNNESYIYRLECVTDSNLQMKVFRDPQNECFLSYFVSNCIVYGWK